jgi:hypothetical protein
MFRTRARASACVSCCKGWHHGADEEKAENQANTGEEEEEEEEEPKNGSGRSGRMAKTATPTRKRSMILGKKTTIDNADERSMILNNERRGKARRLRAR